MTAANRAGAGAEGSWRPEPPPDVGRLVGLVGPGATALAALFAVTFVLISVVSTPQTLTSPPLLLALAITIAAAGIVTIGGPTPIPWWRVVAVWVVALADVPLVAWTLPMSGPIGYTSWYVGATSFLCFALALRGRLVGAWIGMALAMAAQWTWSVVATGSIWFGLSTDYSQPIVLLAGTIFSFGLHRAARRILALQEAQERLATEEGFADAQIRRRRERVERIRRDVRPLLTAIAEGRGTPDDRLDAAIVEAALRDEIRGGRLAAEPLATAAREARRRGVEVLLLDDAPSRPVDPQALAEARRRIAERLPAVGEGELTVRLSADGEGIAVWLSSGATDVRIGVESGA